MTSEPTVGVIIPPPELRNIVDKTASFVARNGPEFESRIQQNEQNNPKFNFLRAGDPYNSYYQFKVKQIREGATTEKVEPSAAPQAQGKFKELIDKAAIPLEPPPEFQFIAEPPTILAMELDIVKLTAQFVAIHGRSFLTNLMNREQRNYQFDFLRPQHGLFTYFTNLIEQYTRVLMPQEEGLRELVRELKTEVLMEKTRHRLEWTKITEAEKLKEQEEVERERMQYAQIDWHDFVIVETVDYQSNEAGNFPPPTTPEQVGSRILRLQRIEQENKPLREEDENTMECESDEEQEQADKEAMPPPPLPPSLDNVLIRKNYDPKAAKKPVAATNTTKGDNWVISPITNERIPAEKLAEHMRYGLLDPRWVEERERSVQEKMQQEEVFAPGVAIENSLKQLAERRTDIFGSGDAETEIGKKIGEEEAPRAEKVTWDGYTSSMEATRKAARANVTIEDQIQQIHKLKGLVEEENKIGPSVVPHKQLDGNRTILSAPPRGPTAQQHQQSHHQQHMQQHQHQQHSQLPPQQMHRQPPQMMAPMHMQHPQMGHQLPPGHLAPPFMLPPNPQMMGLFNPMGGGMIPPPPPGTMNFGVPQPAPLMQEQDSMEPNAKKMRTEESLIPEEEFLATHSGTIFIQVLAPNHPEKPELELHGQVLHVQLGLTDMVSAIKTKVNEQIGLAPGKQKLVYEGMFIKDSNTLAFYNMGEGTQVQLLLKERGGRKK